MLSVTIEDIEAAHQALHVILTRTPLQHNARLSQQFGAEIYFKREDRQVVRSYKLRGAFNLIHSLETAQRKRGVVCASAGNHAQGVAFTCCHFNIEGRIYMPQNTPRQKIQRVRNLGGEWVQIELVGDTFDDTYFHAAEYARQTQKVFVHPFNDARIIAGQGTVGIEISEQLPTTPDFLIAPIGGGGLMSGLAVCRERYFPHTSLIGVEPAGAACMLAAFDAGHPVTLSKMDTFVDGAAVRTAGNLTFDLCRREVQQIVAVAEGKICTEMIDLYQNEGIIVEPAGALSVAALSGLQDKIRGKRVVCVLSGGNNDITRYPEIIERSLIDKGLKHYFLIEFSQRPGALRRYLDEALGANDDITLFEYIKKSNREYGPALVGIELTNREDFAPLLLRMDDIGLRYEIIYNDSALFRFVL
jgi:threonine dehydratase